MFTGNLDNTEIFDLVANVPATPEPSTKPKTSEKPALSLQSRFALKGKKFRMYFNVSGDEIPPSCSYRLYKFAKDSGEDIQIASLSLRDGTDMYALKMKRMKKLPKRLDPRLSQLKASLFCGAELVSEGSYQTIRGLNRGKGLKKKKRDKWFRQLSRRLQKF